MKLHRVSLLAVAFSLLPVAARPQVVLLSENFEGLALNDSVEEGIAGPIGDPGGTAASKVWTNVPPPGWQDNDTGVPGIAGAADNNGVFDWAGWNFAARDWWVTTAGDQRRSEFTNGSGTIMVADPDEWDDAVHPGGPPSGPWYSTFISTASISLAGIASGTVVVDFDSSWRPEFDSNYHQTANITVSYDGAAPVEVLRWESDPASPNFHADAPNEHVTLGLNHPMGAAEMVLTFGLFDAGNDWWWAIDNLEVIGEPGNQPPDCSGAVASLSSCWPPNHKFVMAQVLGVVDPEGDPVTVTITDIAQDEPVRETGRGSGSTCPDGVLVDTNGSGTPDAAGIRCERDGAGNGRVYTISFVAADTNGGACSGSVTICVPRDRRGGCANDGAAYDSRLCADGAGGQAGGGIQFVSLTDFEAMNPAPHFIRADVDWDGSVGVTDAIRILDALFLSHRWTGSLDCRDAADTNDDGEVDVTDAIHLLLFLYSGGLPPPPPVLEPGSDPTSDSLGCE